MNPDYKLIEKHIRRARLERSIYLAEVIADGIVALAWGLHVVAVRFNRLAQQGRARLDRTRTA